MPSSTSRSRGVRRSIGDSLRLDRATSVSTTFGSTIEPPLGDLLDREEQLVGIGNALLQEIGPPLRTLIEQRERVAVFGELRQHDHPDRRVLLAQLGRGADAFVRPGRRHPDVGQDDVGCVRLDGIEQRRKVADRRDDLDVVIRRQQGSDSLAHDERILRHDHPNRHACER